MLAGNIWTEMREEIHACHFLLIGIHGWKYNQNIRNPEMSLCVVLSSHFPCMCLYVMYQPKPEYEI